MNDKTKLDTELVELYVDEYDSVAQGLYPDLEQAVACCGRSFSDSGYIEEPNVSDDDMRDALSDTMADRIYDEETQRGSKVPFPEIREAANRIAIRYCGEPS